MTQPATPAVTVGDIERFLREDAFPRLIGPSMVYGSIEDLRAAIIVEIMLEFGQDLASIKFGVVQDAMRLALSEVDFEVQE